MIDIKKKDSYIIKMSKVREHLMSKGEVEKAQEMITKVFHNPEKVDEIIKNYIDEK